MSKVQDAQQNLAMLRRESVELANEITLKRSELDSLQTSIKKEYENLSKEKALLDDEKKKIADAKEQQREAERQHLLQLNEIERNKKNLSQQVKELTKELVKINTWILEGKEEYDSLQKSNILLNAQLAERAQTLSDIELLREAKTALSQEVLALKIDLSEMSDASRQSLYLAKQAKDNELEEYKKIKLEREKEEIALFNLRERRIQMEHDISIYVKRAQVVYKKAFPELEMNL